MDKSTLNDSVNESSLDLVEETGVEIDGTEKALSDEGSEEEEEEDISIKEL